jgi:transposase IS116/IS110/IS902 family protein
VKLIYIERHEMSMTGIGCFSAIMISSEIGDINRFSSPQKLVSWAGLCPSIHQSRISLYMRRMKDGNKKVRWILSIVAVCVVGRGLDAHCYLLVPILVFCKLPFRAATRSWVSSTFSIGFYAMGLPSALESMNFSNSLVYVSEYLRDSMYSRNPNS